MENFDFDFQYHWMTVTLYPGEKCKGDAFMIKRIIESTFRGSCIEHTGHGANAYSDLEVWQGIRLSYGGEINGGTYSLSISGEHIGGLNLVSMREFLEKLEMIGFRLKFTRLDLAFDVNPDKLTIDKVHNAIQESNFKCRATREKCYYYKQFFGNEESCVFGSRASTRYMRIYNRRGYVRFELELKGDAAEFNWGTNALFGCDEHVSSNFSLGGGGPEGLYSI